MHLHIGTVDFVPLAMFLIIFGFLWRSLSAHLADRPIGQAMAYIY